MSDKKMGDITRMVIIEFGDTSFQEKFTMQLQELLDKITSVETAHEAERKAAQAVIDAQAAEIASLKAAQTAPTNGLTISDSDAASLESRLDTLATDMNNATFAPTPLAVDNSNSTSSDTTSNQNTAPATADSTASGAAARFRQPNLTPKPGQQSAQGVQHPHK